MSDKTFIVQLSNSQKKANLNPNKSKIAPETFYIIDKKRYIDIFKAINSQNVSTSYNVATNPYDVLISDVAMNELLSVYDSARNLLSDKTLDSKVEILKKYGIIKEVDENNLFAIKENDLENYNFCRKSEFKDVLKNDIYASFSKSFSYLSTKKVELHKTFCEDTAEKINTYFYKRGDSEEILANAFYDHLLSQGFNKDSLMSTVMDFYRYNPDIVEQKTKIYLDTLLKSNNIRSQYLKSALDSIPLDKEEVVNSVLKNIYGVTDDRKIVIEKALYKILDDVEITDETTFTQSLQDSLKRDLNNPINQQLYSRLDLNTDAKRLDIFNTEMTFDVKSVEAVLDEDINFQNEFKITGKELKEVLSKTLLGFTRPEDDYIFSNKTYEEIIDEKAGYDDHTYSMLRLVVDTLQEHDIRDKNEYTYSEFLSVLKEATNYRGTLDYIQGSFLGIAEINNKESLYYLIDDAKKMFMERSMSGNGNTFEDNFKKFVSNVFEDYGFILDKDSINIRDLSDYRNIEELSKMALDMNSKSINFENLAQSVEELYKKNARFVNLYYGISGNDLSMDYALPSLIDNQKNIVAKPLNNEVFYDMNSVSLFDLNNLMREIKRFKIKEEQDLLYEAKDFEHLSSLVANNVDFRKTFLKEFLDGQDLIVDLNDKEEVSKLLANMANLDLVYSGKFFELHKEIEDFASSYKPKFNDLLIINEKFAKMQRVEEEIKSFMPAISFQVSNVYTYEPFRKCFEKYFNEGNSIPDISTFHNQYSEIARAINFDNPKNRELYDKFLKELNDFATKHREDEDFKELFPSKMDFDSFYRDVLEIKKSDTINTKKQQLSEIKKDLNREVHAFLKAYNSQIPEWNTSLEISKESLTRFLSLNTEELTKFYSKQKEQEIDKKMFTELSDMIKDKNYQENVIFDSNLIRQSLENLYQVPFVRDIFLEQLDIKIDDLETSERQIESGYYDICRDFTMQLITNDDNSWEMFNNFKNKIEEIQADMNGDLNKELLDCLSKNVFEKNFLATKKMLFDSDLRERIVDALSRDVILDKKEILEREMDTVSRFVDFYNDKYAKGEESKLTTDSLIRFLSMDEEFIKHKELSYDSPDFLNNKKEWIQNLKHLNSSRDIREDFELRSTINSFFNTFAETRKETPVPSFTSGHSLGSLDFAMSIVSQHTNALHEFSQLMQSIESANESTKQLIENINQKIPNLTDEDIMSLIDSKNFFREDEKQFLLECIKESNDSCELLEKIGEKFFDEFAKMNPEDKNYFLKNCTDIFNDTIIYGSKLMSPDFEDLHSVSSPDKYDASRPKGILVSEGRILESKDADFVYSENTIKSAKLVGVLSNEFLEHFNYKEIVSLIENSDKFKIFCHEEFTEKGLVRKLNTAAVVVCEQNNVNEKIYGILLESNTGERIVLTAEMINKEFGKVDKVLVDEDYFKGVKKGAVERTSDERSFGADNVPGSNLNTEPTKVEATKEEKSNKEIISNNESFNENNEEKSKKSTFKSTKQKNDEFIDAFKPSESSEELDTSRGQSREATDEELAKVNPEEELADLADLDLP